MAALGVSCAALGPNGVWKEQLHELKRAAVQEASAHEAACSRLDKLCAELRSGLELPAFQSLEWRLQMRLGGRFVPRQEPQPSFLLRLRTSGGGASSGGASDGGGGATEHLMQADLTNMRRLTSELEAALKEDKSTHSRRIARRL